MNITNRITHDVQQGTGAWLRLREGFDTASEAPAALGVSKYTTRAELLRHKHTRIAPEHSPATLGKFAAGHAAEAAARPMAEAIIGGDLYPTTMTAEVDGLALLASLDGQTLDGDIIWETKLWNEQLAADVRAGTLDPHYTAQMDQELLVGGADRCLFTCTDGTPERFVCCWYEANPAKFSALVAGWHQFRADLPAYTLPPAAEAAPVGKAPDTLPALRIEVTGQVTASNLAEFKATALTAIRSVNRDLKTDADFADADKAVKWCADVESRLKAAKEHALSQTASIDELFKALDDIAAESKAVRLDLAKVIDRRKVEVKEHAVAAARKALDEHVASLNAELAPMRLQPAPADFAGAIKGLRSIASMQDALNSTLAAGKIAADAQAKLIRGNAAAFRVAAEGLEFLFSDLGSVIHKAPDDFAALLQSRIGAHRAAEDAREVKRKADEEAAKVKRDADEAAAVAAKAERERQAAPLIAPAAMVQQPLAPAVVAPITKPAKQEAPAIPADLMRYLKPVGWRVRNPDGTYWLTERAVERDQALACGVTVEVVYAIGSAQ
jgi:predicted phage-related endonuclease